MARLYDYSHHTSPNSAPQHREHHLLLVGGGPRSVIQLTAEVCFLYTYRRHFTQLADLGAQYSLRTTLVEKQPTIAPGAAFAHGHTGMANTGVESDITFPLPPPDPTSTSIQHMLSYQYRFTNLIAKTAPQYYQQLKQLNFPGAIMFRRSLGPMSATPSGTPDYSFAFLMRRTIGEEEVQTFQHVKSLANQLPFYKLDLLANTQLHSITTPACDAPRAHVRHLATGTATTLTADQIRLNTGTILRHPVSDPAVRQFTFAQPMNVSDMSRFFAQHHLLAPDATLRPGVRILCGGLSLSSLDQLSALDRIMHLFEEDETSLLGYRVSDRAKRLYQRAITIVSRTPGKACAVRHSATPEWQQATDVIGSTEHLHALFLHENGQEVFQMWYEIIKAAVARASNHTPGELDASHPTEELLRSRYEETLRFLDSQRKAGLAELQGRPDVKERLLKEATRTLSGAWRQAALSLITGFGPESDMDAARSQMESLAPITFKGRCGLMMHRAQISSVTHPRTAFHQSNQKIIGNMRKLMNYVTASPVQVHSMFHLLLESGIAEYVSASYSEVTCDPTGSCLHLAGEDYDALIISPLFDRTSDKAVNSLTGQVRPIHPSAPSYGQVGKFRQIISKDGTPLPIEDNGLSGAGFQLREGAGKGSLVGAYAVDINNRSSAVSTSASYAMRRMAMSHLKAAGFESPTTTLAEIYAEQTVDEEAYENEVRSFEKYFKEIHEMWAYLKAIRACAGEDSHRYCDLYDRGITAAGRAMAIEEISLGSKFEAGIAARYLADVIGMPAFNPPGRDEYLERFVDTTPEEDKAAYEAAFELARTKLLSERPALATI